ncbi:MAG: ATP-binding protein [Oscillospiraceae bacterium]|nr:ATP-binding protein [Oscillospiraceae bacterium]
MRRAIFGRVVVLLVLALAICAALCAVMYGAHMARAYGSIPAGLRAALPGVIFAAAVALVVAVLLTGVWMRGVTSPLQAFNRSLEQAEDGRVTLKPEEYQYEELQELAGKINTMSADIGEHIARVEDEQDKTGLILDSVKEGFILLDGSQKVLMINQSACAYLGCDKGVTGRHLIYCTRNMQLLDAMDRVVERAGEKTSVDLLVSGKVIETEFAAVSGRYDSAGGMIITMTDATERRNAVKMRRDFFSNASHELKTPITSIKGSAELLCSGIDLEESQRSELVRRIGMETERMSELVSDIILISRMESGEPTGTEEAVDFTALVEECCDEVAPIAEQSGLTMHRALAPVVLVGNRKNLRDLVSNLLVNAVKYNRPEGQVDVELREEGDNVVFMVRNDGEPIAPEHQRRVFERFYRVDSGRSKQAGGSGLGLAIVKHVVDSHGGTIALESNAALGTCFTITLPKHELL